MACQRNAVWTENGWKFALWAAVLYLVKSILWMVYEDSWPARRQINPVETSE